jgi:hypothetical protein
MAVDVVTEIDIARPRDVVSTFAADPTNAPAWYVNIASAAWLGAPEIAVGNTMAFHAQFLGRRLEYTYAVRDFVPGERLVMATEDGPFAMETTYEWTDTPPGGTRMTLRNRGEPTGFARIARPVMERAMRRANQKDLRRLKQILETGRDQES